MDKSKWIAVFVLLGLLVLASCSLCIDYSDEIIGVYECQEDSETVIFFPNGRAVVFDEGVIYDDYPISFYDFSVDDEGTISVRNDTEGISESWLFYKSDSNWCVDINNTIYIRETSDTSEYNWINEQIDQYCSQTESVTETEE